MKIIDKYAILGILAAIAVVFAIAFANMKSLDYPASKLWDDVRIFEVNNNELGHVVFIVKAHEKDKPKTLFSLNFKDNKLWTIDFNVTSDIEDLPGTLTLQHRSGSFYTFIDGKKAYTDIDIDGIFDRKMLIRKKQQNLIYFWNDSRREWEIEADK
ncbi:hypothetical protein [Sedimentisphaera salicampi]|uniref:Uncharacterized protein n=1 Tax=Sedimentisphaera salicampi TaxID=1941349 RepID=A0A1W6LLC5_9BACT|nr:hypothetical protein [Sedimentisphaera salicampi]ARN56565.1 hypothetical protein STSP1_00948 [Sedimentisphaera salicampi]